MLLEKTVQKRALTFLERYYNNRFSSRKIFAAAEVRTKKTFGGKRADGLLAFQGRITGKPYVVSMEALGSGLFYIVGQAQNPLTFIAPIIWCLLAGVAFGILTWQSYRHKTVDVITQLKQYPANEQWLAFSKDAFKALTEEKRKMLQKICYYRGIGLLVIGTKTNIEVLTKPTQRWYWFWDARRNFQWISDYLIYYSKEKEIRRAI